MTAYHNNSAETLMNSMKLNNFSFRINKESWEKPDIFATNLRNLNNNRNHKRFS